MNGLLASRAQAPPGPPRTQALPGDAMSCRLRRLRTARVVGPLSGSAARRSLAGSAFPGRAWERGSRDHPVAARVLGLVKLLISLSDQVVRRQRLLTRRRRHAQAD